MLKLGDLLKAAGLNCNDSQTSHKKQNTAQLPPQKNTTHLRPSHPLSPKTTQAPPPRHTAHQPDYYNERRALPAIPTPAGPATQATENTFKIFSPPSSGIDFKPTPSAWVSHGQSTQISDGAALPIHIGIDFGTAFTKVAVKTKNKIWIVDWSGIIQEENTYLLPGELSILPNGTTLLGVHSGLEIFNNLKVPFLLKVDEGLHLHTTCFLAWVMKYTRAWIFQNLRNQIYQHRLTWDITIGIPTETWDKGDRSKICEKIAIMAWNTSLTNDISLANAMSAPSDIETAYDLNTLSSQPEFRAEIMSYSKSPQRTNGLHFFCDIGAGTLDLCTIIITEKNFQPHYSVLEARVHPLGAYHLELGGSQCEPKIYSAISNILGTTKKKRDPRFFIHGTPLPHSLLGGGRSDPRYLKQLHHAANHPNAPIKLSDNPIDIQMDKYNLETNLPDDIAHRFLVATGLCWNDEDFGSITHSNDIDDICPYTPDEQIDIDERYS
ncbi:hypothetical protein [Nitratidesulfovibrio liaohensis]|uniref:hypothetical protein n=1 Tax=Nitratidesulfovibrio liaohensis TaxID=2604158 RepID=UPI00141E3525|nr:hypothetical protein [Nitratidesulfovibrio liaohensis]NHZ47042.1 hypothetical protein [Nitratidesulfovibrio liaohensis]